MQKLIWENYFNCPTWDLNLCVRAFRALHLHKFALFLHAYMYVWWRMMAFRDNFFWQVKHKLQKVPYIFFISPLQLYKWRQSERGELKKKDYQSKGFTSAQITVHLLIKHTISRLCIWQRQVMVHSDWNYSIASFFSPFCMYLFSFFPYIANAIIASSDSVKCRRTFCCTHT